MSLNIKSQRTVALVRELAARTGTNQTAAVEDAVFDGPGVAIGRSGAAIGTATFVAGPIWPLDTCLFVRDFKGNDPR